MKIVVLGAPGAGKGTQADKLAEYYHIPHISTGDILRENMRQKTEIGLAITELMNQGSLVPDEIAIDILKKRTKEEDTINGFILDGFPRTLLQAEHLEQIVGAIDNVVSVEVPFENIIKRVSGRRVCTKCGASYHILNNPPKVEGVCDVCNYPLTTREDDKEQSVKNRLAIYQKETDPIKNYFKQQNKLISIDGTKSIDKVEQDIIESLKN